MGLVGFLWMSLCCQLSISKSPAPAHHHHPCKYSTICN